MGLVGNRSVLTEMDGSKSWFLRFDGLRTKDWMSKKRYKPKEIVAAAQVGLLGDERAGGACATGGELVSGRVCIVCVVGTTALMLAAGSGHLERLATERLVEACTVAPVVGGSRPRYRGAS